MLGVTYPWITAGHPERVVLEALPGAAGLIPFAESVHGDLLGLQSGGEAAFLAVLSETLGVYNLQHDDLARAIWHVIMAYRYRTRSMPEAAGIQDLEVALFPAGLQIVSASYLESAGQAEIRRSLLTEARRAVLAGIPMQGGTLLDLVTQWNQVGVDMGNMQNQRATPPATPAERANARAVRDRWVRVVRAVLDVLALEANQRPEARRIIERVDNIRAAVKRRRAGNGTDTPGDDDGTGEPGDDDGAPVPTPGDDGDELGTP